MAQGQLRAGQSIHPYKWVGPRLRKLRAGWAELGTYSDLSHAERLRLLAAQLGETVDAVRSALAYYRIGGSRCPRKSMT